MIPRARGGIALVEVLVALVLLALLGAAYAGEILQVQLSLRGAARADMRSLEAAQVLARLVTWNRDSFVDNLGQSQRGRWTLVVAPRGLDLFDAEVHATPSGPVVLRTTMYRREVIDAPR